MSRPAEPVVFMSEYPHVRQSFTWDCGLACATMVLAKHGIVLDEKDVETKSVWTIDIAYLLHRHAIQFKLFTRVLGADENHSGKMFYRASFNRDERRVNVLFDTAEDMGMDVARRSLSAGELREILMKRSPIIVLLNSTRIHCDNCAGTSMGILGWVCRQAFVGHYVLLVGYDHYTDSVLYRDPGVSQSLCTMKWSRFESARKCPGTDEDLIVL